MNKRILYVSDNKSAFSESNLVPIDFNGFDYTPIYDMLRAEKKLSSRKYSGLIIDGLDLCFSNEFPEAKSPGHVATLLGIAKRLNIPSLVISDSKDLESKFNICGLADKVISYPLNPFEYSKIIKEVFYSDE